MSSAETQKSDDRMAAEKQQPASSFTAVNGRTSPHSPQDRQANGKPSITLANTNSSKMNGSQSEGGPHSASMSTSPSIINSATTQQHESPISPNTAANTPSTQVGKRTYPEAFGNETEGSSTRPRLQEHQGAPSPHQHSQQAPPQQSGSQQPAAAPQYNHSHASSYHSPNHQPHPQSPPTHSQAQAHPTVPPSSGTAAPPLQATTGAQHQPSAPAPSLGPAPQLPPPSHHGHPPPPQHYQSSQPGSSSDPHAHARQYSGDMKRASYSDEDKTEGGEMSPQSINIIKQTGDGHPPLPHTPNAADMSKPKDVTTITRTPAGVQVDRDRTKRKRVFSNRTKTGCMTCRKRKKKCDEQHPECNNCLRGGFICEGYSQRTGWQKPGSQKPGQMVLQAKSSYSSLQPQHQGQPQQPPSVQTHPQQHPRYADQQDVNGQMTPPNEGRSHTQQSWPVIQPAAYQPRQPGPPGQGGRSVLESPHDAHDPGSAYPSSRHSSIYGPQQPPQQQQQQQQQPNGYPPQPPSQSQHQHNSSVGSSNMPPTSHAGSGSTPSTADAIVKRPQSGNLTEREKMLRGDYYLPFTPALQADREQCAESVFRFSKACDPTTGLVFEDRMRMFARIVQLRPLPDPTLSPDQVDNSLTTKGNIGPGCVVEYPFRCDYGYNLTLGAEVVIRPNCYISDTAAVSIGNGVCISPNVTILCSTYDLDPRERRKGKGRSICRGVTIEDDVWIGAGVTILPGATIRRGSCIGTGSIVHEEVPAFTVWSGNPATMVRSVYD